MDRAKLELDDVFCAALELPAPAERAAYLDEVCGADLDSRRRVERLLAAHSQAGSFLAARPAVAAVTSDLPAETTGTQIGPYKLMERIGEGGMGLVFVAEQQHPVRRKVAVKVIKPGMDTRQVIARFEAERQALALMDHVNIARVLDAGATETGRPYFVMELVKGLPITQFCDDNRLTARQRLELFSDVCNAVQHAHQKGIIHRDIKPSNVLVTSHDGKPVVKVIDFGVAKAIGQQLTDKTLYTQLSQLIGTPLYMSPEQAGQSGLDVDTRTDIYALGVLLYELLTGTTPFDQERFRTAGYDEMRRIIREEEPPKPSTRISTLGQAATTVSAQRQSDPKRLSRLFRGELDWIVMKALEKDRNRRYETASVFAADVQRYLADEPVQACPPTAWYRFRKFARRNKGALTVAGIILFFFVLLGSGIGWVVRDRVARQAVLENEVTRALEEAENWYNRDNLPEAFAAVKRAEALLADGSGKEELRQRVRNWRDDIDMVARLEEIRLEHDTVLQLQDWGSEDHAYREAFRRYGLDVEGLDPDEAAARIRASRIKDGLVAALDDWAHAKQAGRFAGREQLLAVARRADADPWRNRFREAFHRKDWKALKTMARDQEVLAQPAVTVARFALVLANRVERKLAAEVLRQAQQRHPNDFWINFDLGSHLEQGLAGEAVGFYRAALALRPKSPAVHFSLGGALAKHGKLEEAIVACRKAISLKPDFAQAHYNLGLVLAKQEKLEEAIASFRKAIEVKPDFAAGHNNLGAFLERQGKVEEAIVAFERAIKLQPDFAAAHYSLANALVLHKNDRDGAIHHFQKTVAIAPNHVQAHYNLASVLLDKKDLDGAIKHYQKAVALDPKLAKAHYHIGNALVRKRDVDGAIEHYQKALAIDAKHVKAHVQLGSALLGKKKVDGAIDHFQKATRFDPRDAEAHYGLGNALQNQGKLDQAIAAYREAIALKPDYATAYNNLGFALWGQRKVDEAIAAYRQAVKLKPDYVVAHLNLSTALKGKGDWEGVRAALLEVIRHEPKHAGAHNNLAWLLATCPDAKVRDPKRALELSEKAVQLVPKHAYFWATLGLARYRAGEWKAAVAASETSLRLLPGGHNLRSFDFLVLAMAHWRLGDKEQARKWYRQAAQWLEKTQPNDEDTGRLRTEAAQLLEIKMPTEK